MIVDPLVHFLKFPLYHFTFSLEALFSLGQFSAIGYPPE